MEKICLPDHKVSVAKLLILSLHCMYNLHKNTNIILYVSLHARKVPNDDPKLWKQHQ